jgi:hypothetical protein
VTQNEFDLECDRLSSVVDAIQFERLRWSRTEGPMLARLVELAHGALEARSEFELAEEGATNDIKRFVLKVHSNRIVAIVIWLTGNLVNIRAEALDRCRYKLAEGVPITADFQLVDEQWMSAALQELFGRVQG